MDIVPAHLAVKAMRDNGYKNAAYALAELMDNSIQAQATKLSLICLEKTELVSDRHRSNIFQIGILDNGTGMNEETLRMALQFGNGANLAPDQQTGMGKFGMGLPASSISQARKVEVWTWQDGIDTAIYSYLDIDKIEKRTQTDVPEPISKVVPKIWQRVANDVGRTGTLVVWSTLDRCMWKTGKAIIDNSEFLIGRMYRKFIAKKLVTIVMSTYDIDNLSHGAMHTKSAVANDPLYLMSPSSTDAPYDKEAMFEPFPSLEGYENKIIVRFRGREHSVYVRASMAKKAAREGGTAGSRGYGRHAQKNIGVSIVRAGRELELDANWAAQGDPRERWWGVEVEFSPGLDDLFGVTNNKQSARNFSEWATTKVEDLCRERETLHQLKERLATEEDPSGPLLDVALYVQNAISQMRTLIHAQLKNSRTNDRTRHGQGFEAEKEATEKTRERQGEGKRGESDKGEAAPTPERVAAIQKELETQGIDARDAEALAALTVSQSLKYTFAEAPLDGPAFFGVQPKGGVVIITLNTNHGAYNRLVDVLEKDPADSSNQNLAERLDNALQGLKLLLMAWARYEDEQPSGKSREQAQDARIDWGRIARRFLDPSDA